MSASPSGQNAARLAIASSTAIAGTIATADILESDDKIDRLPPNCRLEELFELNARQRPTAPAVFWRDCHLTFGELNDQADLLAATLRQTGLRPGQLVAICCSRSPDLIAALLAILKAGGAYVPLDPTYPTKRLRFMLEDSGASLVLTTTNLEERFVDCAARTVLLDRLGPGSPAPVGSREPAWESAERPSCDALAYVIYTSGSTGLPKGVAITHRSAANTILDVNTRFAVGAQHRVLAISSVAFDLSVYDIFGLLAAGGAIILPEDELSREPSHWLDLVERHEVTIWNSVPAFMEMLVASLPPTEGSRLRSLKTVLLSGDWIAVSLPDRIRELAPQTKIVSLGGATEGAIWSICYEIGDVNPAWKSIPYGRPLANQTVRVLNESFEPCAIGVTGELYLGGEGIATCYWNRPELTAERFLPDPFRIGGRLFRTGDLGRLLPDGNIEFLGRSDDQVKIGGFRIELGEIETALVRHPSIAEAAVVARKTKTGRPYLAAYLLPREESLPSDDDLCEFLRRGLPEFMLPATFTRLKSLPLTANGKVDRRALPVEDHPPGLDARGYAMPRDVIEVRLVQIWETVLGIRPIGIADNYFALGGDSLTATAIVAKVEQQLGRKVPLAVLNDHPTIEQLAELLRENRPAALSSLVVLQAGTGPALFCLPGVHGSIWEFRKLVAHLAIDWPVYALQPLGIDGHAPPHETIAELAAYYLEQVREAQPQGPYHLLGFSLGGMAAYEMAQQARAFGDEIGLVCLLNAPVRGLSKMVRQMSGVVKKLRSQPLPPCSPAMVAAHKRALDAYQRRHYPGHLTLIQSSDDTPLFRRWFYGATLDWAESADSSEIHIVPGDHGGVFERGNIEVLADKLKQCLLKWRASA
ncbi:MAG TPA: amino acid adenylation domain-containing protein [Pirellulales bacterium]|nr:amino acid adenylation domain-containing protein [Pirellulales bacterium]